jgi:hypothetical protein
MKWEPKYRKDLWDYESHQETLKRHCFMFWPRFLDSQWYCFIWAVKVEVHSGWGFTDIYWELKK